MRDYLIFKLLLLFHSSFQIFHFKIFIQTHPLKFDKKKNINIIFSMFKIRNVMYLYITLYNMFIEDKSRVINPHIEVKVDEAYATHLQEL